MIDIVEKFGDVFTPDPKKEEIVAKLSVHPNGRMILSEAYHNDEKLGISHISSDTIFAQRDILVFNKDKYDKLFPDGWTIRYEYVFNTESEE